MPSELSVRVELLPSPADPDTLAQLAALLVEAVDSGFSVGFLRGFDAAAARAWWQQLLADPAVLTWVARSGDRIDGTVSLLLEGYPTGEHRAEVTKLLVRGPARRRGLATALLTALEVEAARRGRTLLLLDTEAGRGGEQLYAATGWREYGRLADHAADPDGHLTPTVFFAKQLPSD